MAKDLMVKRIDDISLWDNFVRESPQGTVFSTSLWLKAAGKAHGGEPQFVGVLKDGKLAAGVSFIHLARGPLKKATTPAMTPYGGFIYRPAPGKRHSEAESFNMACTEKLIEYLSGRYNHVFLVHCPEFTDARPFSWAGWDESVQYTYALDISDTDKLWDLIERRVRTVIRNAESSLKIGGAIDTDRFTGLYERIYRDRGHALPFGTPLVRAMIDEILKTDIAEMRAVHNSDGDVISAMILVHDERCVYSWISGSIPDENTTGAFSLLFWDSIKRYSESHKRLDMVGANIPSIAFFKKGFAGKLMPYYVTEYFSSLISKLSFKAYSLLKRGMR